MAVHSLSQICKDSGIQISTLMSKVMDFHGANPIQAYIVVDSTDLQPIGNIKYLGCNEATQDNTNVWDHEDKSTISEEGNTPKTRQDPS